MLLLTESEAAKNAFDLVSSVSGEVAGLMSFLKIFGGRGGWVPWVPWDFVNHFSLLFRNEKFRGKSFRSENRLSFQHIAPISFFWQ